MSQQPAAAAARRPKLSLKTTDSPRACGRSTTGLTFASSIVSAAASGGRICLTPTSATASPTTARNTFSNAYAINGTPTSATAVLSPARYTTPGPLHLHSPLSTRNKLPYQQPLHIRSILRNSPLPTQHRRRITSSSTSSPLFPRVKRVRYADPLAREIRTEIYVKSHFELVAGGVEEGEVVGRRRRREWTWTLGPVGVIGAEGGKKRAREEDEDEDEDGDYTTRAEPSDEDEDSTEASSPPQPNHSEQHPNKRLKLSLLPTKKPDTPDAAKPPPPTTPAPAASKPGQEDGLR
ncbi:MAG: hypothetical protein M1839_003046 [Geoglossum umbratile]|nr:MAG: hypothetical protein M1839_003046 [Geoglossum umbratile]